MITVHADMCALMRGEMTEELETPVIEDDNNLMGYVSNAIMAACNSVVYAEAVYGPIAAELIIEGLKGDIVKNTLEQVRKEKDKCESDK